MLTRATAYMDVYLDTLSICRSLKETTFIWCSHFILCNRIFFLDKASNLKLISGNCSRAVDQKSDDCFSVLGEV